LCPGTYIRAIARDLGEKLQVGGTLAGLERTESCGMKLSDSVSLEQLKIEVEQGNFTPISPELGLKHLIDVSLLEIEGQRWCQGQKIVYPSFNGVSVPQIVRVHEAGGKFLGMGEIVLGETDKILIPKVVM
jgi:tRNA pseudouridine55 synthase